MSVTLTPGTVAPPRPTAVDPSPVPVLATVAEYAATLDALRAAGRTVGLVPTMGALHAGHRSLIRRAAEECDVVAVSIFVNPTQFGDASDLANYPRTLESDLDVVSSAGGSLVFAPTVTEMYPEPPGSSPATVAVPAFSGLWEGASRPGHFDGVATVVVKLLSATGRCRAYFGEKDFQQLAMVTTVARQLLLPAEVVGCRTVRDTDGLALSSRNVRLSPDERTGRAGPVPGPPGRGLPHPPWRGEPGPGGGADGPGGGRGARCHSGLRGGGARRRARAGMDLRHRPSVAPADRGRGGTGPADRQSRPPAGLLTPA